MPIIKVTDDYCSGLAIPEESTLVVKTPPGLTMAFQIRSRTNTILIEGTTFEGGLSIDYETLKHLPAPAIFFKNQPALKEETIIDVGFV